MKKQIKEMGAASSGAAGGFGGQSFKLDKNVAIVSSEKGKKKKPKKVKTAQLYQEAILRDAIRRLIELSSIKYFEDAGRKALDEMKLRGVIRSLLSEKAEPTPYNNTGLNTAAEVIQRIKRTIIDTYKSLTSSDKQRKDFIATVEDMVKKAIEQQDLMKKIEAGNAGQQSTTPEQTGGEEEFDVSGLTEQDEEGGEETPAEPEQPAVPMANAGEEAKSDQEKSAAQAKQIATQVTSTEPDTTGGSKAIPVVSTIVPQILTARDTLKDAKDKQAFDLAIVGGNGQIGNIKAFADIAEKEIQATVTGNSTSSTTPETGETESPEAELGSTETPEETPPEGGGEDLSALG